ncbi:hypothetical protein KNT64_gp196 [Pseudomonas phage PspYZU05]|uniref:Uncharacterized protein n=1 Tax=Pseudomonas phage PspYZU05 TaxID=1983556 RepID=A0A2U7NLY0_9CAUD|nr:hypothetical protein KNT64_gp196 [Pseudomonas phage PspYZU05]ASD52148.1 hypothetical protein PspYZU05_196 [Pseudomonas phage PspYZU05]
MKPLKTSLDTKDTIRIFNMYPEAPGLISDKSGIILCKVQRVYRQLDNALNEILLNALVSIKDDLEHIISKAGSKYSIHTNGICILLDYYTDKGLMQLFLQDLKDHIELGGLRLSSKNALRNCMQRKFADLMAVWPKYSGNRNYPVPAPSSYAKPNPEDAYYNCECWTSEYGQLRIELLDFCIAKLTKKVNFGNSNTVE